MPDPILKAKSSSMSCESNMSDPFPLPSSITYTSPREVQRHARDSIYQGDVPSMLHLPANENDSFRTLSSINRDNSACNRKGK